MAIAAVLRSRSAWLLGLLAVFVTLSMSGIACASASGCSGGGSSGVAPYLFDCRAYELVSPAYKEGYSVTVDGLSEDGQRVFVNSTGSFSHLENISPLVQKYEIARGDKSWEAAPLEFSGFSGYTTEGVTPDFQSNLERATVFAGMPPHEEVISKVYLGLPGGSLVPLGPQEAPASGGGRLLPIGASEDLHRVLLLIHSPSSFEASSLWPGDTTAGGFLPSLYEYEYTTNARGEPQEAREPRLVGVSNSGQLEGHVNVNEGAHLISDCGISLGGFPSLGGDAYNAVSASGAAVFFTATASGSCGGSGPPVNEVYARMRETPTVRAHTVAISEPSLSVPGRECTGVCREDENQENGHERREGLFVGASRDGSRVFFLTRQPLVNGDEKGEGTGQDLYEADISDGAVTGLVQVSRGGLGDHTLGSGAGVLGVARVSGDGSHVYFVAEGRLTSEPRRNCLSGLNPAELAEEEATKERRCRPKKEADNLYVYDTVTSETSFIATLGTEDGLDWSSQDERPVQTTADGHFLVFQSTADLTPDQEGREREAGQVFEYDAQTETLVRVSRGQGGFNEDGNSSVYGATIPVQSYEPETPIGIGRFRGLAVSADGSRVFFSTKDALTPQALNGVMNVYEYHAGQVGLISDGHDTVLTGGRPAVELIGTDESGRDVFFTTADGLVPQDTDDQVDVYDARFEGGFAPPTVPAPCAGDSCQAPPSVPPSLLVPGMSSSTGDEPQAKGASKKRLGKRRRKAKKSRQRKARKSTAKTHRGVKAIGRGR